MFVDHRNSTVTPTRGQDAKGKHSPWTNPRLKKMHKSSPPWKLPDVAEERCGDDLDRRSGGCKSPAAQDLKLRFADENCPPSPLAIRHDDQQRHIAVEQSHMGTSTAAGRGVQVTASGQLLSHAGRSSSIGTDSTSAALTSGAWPQPQHAPAGPAIQPPCDTLLPQVDQLGSPQGLPEPQARQPRRRRLSVLRKERAPLPPEASSLHFLPSSSSSSDPLRALSALHSRSCEFPTSQASLDPDNALASMCIGLGPAPLDDTSVPFQLSWPPATSSHYHSLQPAQDVERGPKAAEHAGVAAKAGDTSGFAANPAACKDAGPGTSTAGIAGPMQPVRKGITIVSRKPKQPAPASAATSAYDAQTGAQLVPMASTRSDNQNGTPMLHMQQPGRLHPAHGGRVISSLGNSGPSPVVSPGLECQHVGFTIMRRIECDDSDSDSGDEGPCSSSVSGYSKGLRSSQFMAERSSPDSDIADSMSCERVRPMRECIRSAELGSESEDEQVDSTRAGLQRALRLAEEEGDADTVQRVWTKLQAHEGAADVNMLNLLLKSFCRVGGNPGEAETLVKEACAGGRIVPNASTYHQLAGMWLRHEQLHAV